MELKTKRTTILALTAEQFRLLLDGKAEMEKALELAPSKTELDAETHEAMTGLYQNAAEHPDDYPWYANWQIIVSEKNISAGSACFMGPPDKNGEVTIGYGIDPAFRNLGYMTEAVTGMTQWALSRPDVKTVCARTDKTNPASHRVLEKSGFFRTGETAKSLFWKKNAEQNF